MAARKKARRNEVHTVPVKDGGWRNQTSGGTKLSAHKIKATAEKKGRKLAVERKAQKHVIHKQDGSVQSERKV